jgi:hypothetical protein
MKSYLRLSDEHEAVLLIISRSSKRFGLVLGPPPPPPPRSNKLQTHIYLLVAKTTKLSLADRSVKIVRVRVHRKTINTRPCRPASAEEEGSYHNPRITCTTCTIYKHCLVGINCTRTRAEINPDRFLITASSTGSRERVRAHLLEGKTHTRTHQGKKQTQIIPHFLHIPCIPDRLRDRIYPHGLLTSSFGYCKDAIS